MQAIITLLKDTIEYYYEEAHLRIGLKIEGIRLLQYSKTSNQHTWCLDKITDLKISKLNLRAFFMYWAEPGPPNYPSDHPDDSSARESDFEEERTESPKVPLWATLALLHISESTTQDPAHITPFGDVPAEQKNAIKPPLNLTGPAIGTIPNGGGTAVFSKNPQKKTEKTARLTPEKSESPEKKIIVKKEKPPLPKKQRKKKKKRKPSDRDEDDPDYEPSSDCKKLPAIKKAYALRKQTIRTVSNPDDPIILNSDGEQMPSEPPINNKTERKISPLTNNGLASATPKLIVPKIPSDDEEPVLNQHGVLENINNSPLSPIDNEESDDGIEMF